MAKDKTDCENVAAEHMIERLIALICKITHANEWGCKTAQRKQASYGSAQFRRNTNGPLNDGNIPASLLFKDISKIKSFNFIMPVKKYIRNKKAL